MTTASYEQIVEVLGDVDPLFVRRVEDTGASIDEIGEALGDLEHERAGGERRLASSPRVAEVRAILEELFDDPDDAEDGRGASLEGP
jgi:DNA-binding transcriptional MerR regulator